MQLVNECPPLVFGDVITAMSLIEKAINMLAEFDNVVFFFIVKMFEALGPVNSDYVYDFVGPFALDVVGNFSVYPGIVADQAVLAGAL